MQNEWIFSILEKFFRTYKYFIRTFFLTCNNNTYPACCRNHWIWSINGPGFHSSVASVQIYLDFRQANVKSDARLVLRMRHLLQLPRYETGFSCPEEDTLPKRNYRQTYPEAKRFRTIPLEERSPTDVVNYRKIMKAGLKADERGSAEKKKGGER